MNNQTTFKGHREIEKIISKRLMNKNKEKTFDLGNFIPSFDLKELLGFYEGNGINDGFRNGDPNTINMLLWQLAFFNFAKDLSQYDTKQDLTFELNPQYKILLTKILEFNLEELMNSYQSEILDEVWNQVMSFDAPETELFKWKETIQLNLKDNSTSQFLIEIHMLIFLNPYFLLKH